MTQSEFLKSVGMEVKVARIRSGMTVKQVEKLTGITDDTINSIERGSRNTSIGFLKSIANAVGVSVKDFFIFVE